MATFVRRKSKGKGMRWTVLVRMQGKRITKTFSTRAAAETWARARERQIETGEFVPVEPGRGALFADLVDGLIKYRQKHRRPFGKGVTNVLLRLKERFGLEPAAALDADFWRRFALDRIEEGAASQTALADLSVASLAMQYGKRERLIANASGPVEARRRLVEEGYRAASRERARRLSDAELTALFKACDKITTSLPLADIVRVALATSMRRGEIMRMRWSDVDFTRRVVRITGRKHPRDPQRVDEVPLMKKHDVWPPWDAAEIIKQQPRRGDRVFPFGDRALSDRFDAACAKAKLADVVFHLLRHESLSRYAERGLDVTKLQVIGGHRSLQHLRRYVRVSAAGLAQE